MTGFTDEETAEVSLVQEMEEVREACVLELKKAAPVAFMEYRNYNRIDLTTKRGWDQYLPKAPGAQCPDPMIVTAPAVVAVVLNVAAGGPGQPRVAGFFAPRTATAATAAPVPALPTATVGLNEPPAVHYDLMADLLDTDMFKVYSDMLRSETLRIQQRKPAKFEYLPMMTAAALGALNVESFCDRVLSCVKLVVSDLNKGKERKEREGRGKEGGKREEEGKEEESVTSWMFKFRE